MIDFSNISLGYIATLITGGIALLLLIVIFIRPGLFISRIFFAIFKTSPVFVLMLFGVTISLITYSFLNPWYIPLTAILIFIGGVKVYEWIDNSFLNDKIGNWFSEQKSIYIKIIPSESSNVTVESMEKFFLIMSGIHGARSEKAQRTAGTYFEQYSIELISDGGKVNMYFKVWKQSLGTLTSGLKLYFPLVQFQEVEDPTGHMPKTLVDLKKEYKHTDFGEFAGFGPDIYATKYYNELTSLKADYKQTPIKQLIECLEAVDDGDMAIIQFNFRPQDTAKTGVKKKWEKELTKVRKQLASNASVSLGANGVVNQFTPTELQTIERIERKIPAFCYETKIRFGLFGKNITGKRYLGTTMAYWKNYATANQGLIPMPKSWDESPSATYGQFWDKLYWEPEVFKRQTQIYSALLCRSLGMGGKIRYFDIEALSSLIQIPNTYLDRKIIQNQQIVILAQPNFQLESKPDSPANLSVVEESMPLEVKLPSVPKVSEPDIQIQNAIPLARPMSTSSLNSINSDKQKPQLSAEHQNYSQAINQSNQEAKKPFIDSQKAIPMPQRLEDENDELFTSVGE